MDGAVGERSCEYLVHAPVLVDERDVVEVRRHEVDLEVVARAGAILDGELDRVRERVCEQRADRLGLHGGHASPTGVRRAYGKYAGGVRILRGLLLFKLGFWAGMLASAALLKRAFPSRGDEESDELRLIAILNGIELRSRAHAFRGGSMFAWLGGIAVDLREAELAPGARLEVGSLLGGIAIRVPPGWKVESDVRSLGGGVAVQVPEPDDPEAPTLQLTGFTALGGIAVGAKPIDG